MTEKEWLYGRHPVHEALRAGRRRAYRLQIASGLEENPLLTEIRGQAHERGVVVEQVSRHTLDTRLDHHQGVALEVGTFPYTDLEGILDEAEQPPDPPLLLVLDLIQDPQNLGTLIRTAEAVGVHGVVLPHRRGVEVTPAVVAASSGACEHLSFAQTNIAQAIRQMKERGIWVAGLDADPAAQRLDRVDLTGPMGLVVGSEGAGLRRLVRESCDFLVRIPMRGLVESLNAAVAGSIALYALWGARGYSGEATARG